MNASERVSVCIPIYNVERYFRDCLESIFRQTYLPAEIILLDDASTDKSFALALRLAQNDSRIRVLRKPHTTLGDTRNILIRFSTSELVACLDADDVADPERLAKQVCFMNAHPTCVALGGAVEFMDEFGHKFFWSPRQMREPAAIENELLRGRASAICQTTLMLRRSAFERIGGYDPSLNCSEDMDLYLRLAEIGELWNLPDVLVHMRRYPGSISGISRRGEAEERRERLVALACSRRGIARLPLLDFVIEPSSREEWYIRSAQGYLDKNSFRVALMHCWQALREAPLSRNAWLLFFKILRRML